MARTLKLLAAFWLSALWIAPAWADDTAPERAWFVKLKGEVGKKAKLGRYGDLEGQALIWFEDRAKPKDKKLLLAPPKAFLEHSVCAAAPPDPSKAAASEEGWWLFESETLPPIALQMSFDGAALWRYDAAQKCLIQWVVPEPKQCTGTPSHDKTYEALWPVCEDVTLIAHVFFNFTGGILGDESKPTVAFEAGDTKLWGRAQFSLPVQSKDGSVTEQRFEAYIDDSSFNISEPPEVSEDGSLGFPEPVFSYDDFSAIDDDTFDDDAARLSGAIWKQADGSILLEIKKYTAHISPGRDDTSYWHKWVSHLHRWNPAKGKFKYLGKISGEDIEDPLSEVRRSEFRDYYIYPLADTAEIAYRSKESSDDKIEARCSDGDAEEDYGGCSYVSVSTRESREIQWTTNINGHDFELMTLKPKATTKKK